MYNSCTVSANTSVLLGMNTKYHREIVRITDTELCPTAAFDNIQIATWREKLVMHFM